MCDCVHMSNDPLLISRKQAAKLLGISIGLFDKLRRRGRIEAVRLNKRALFRREDVERLALTPSQRKVLTSECVDSLQ